MGISGQGILSWLCVNLSEGRESSHLLVNRGHALLEFIRRENLLRNLLSEKGEIKPQLTEAGSRKL